MPRPRALATLALLPFCVVLHAQDLPANGNAVAVYAAGDIANCRRHLASAAPAGATAELVASALADSPYALVLTLGDHTYPLGEMREFKDCYEPTWGRFKARTRPTPGNHEYYLPHAGAYFAYFGAAAGPARRGYYSFGAGTWRVVSLNSNLRPADHRLQLDWLAEELKANPARCILAFWHHPRFSSGEHGDHAQMTRAWTLLQAAGADVVLSAHEHLYERFAPQDADGRRNEAHGIRQFVVGTGGAPLDPFRGTKPNSEARNSDVHGVLKLTLRDGGYDWEFLAVEPDRYTDRGSGACKAAPSPSGDRP